MVRPYEHQIESEPKDNQVLLRLLAAPINPADINQIQGVYPRRPAFTTKLGTSEPTVAAGNEGVFEVVKTGSKVTNCKPGDWALPGVSDFGTWRTWALAESGDLNPITEHSNLTPVQAAMVSVNPTTAYQMLQEFVDLKPGDWFIQNGANSAVGRAAIQIGRMRGLRSINVVRDRPDLDAMKQELTSLGADHVITEEEAASREFQSTIDSWTQKAPIQLALNCVGGKSATSISRKLAFGGHLVTYGAMSKKPLTMGNGQFIFQNIHAHGYWLSEWARQHPEDKKKLERDILKLISEGKFKTGPVTTNKWTDSQTEEEFGQTFKKAMQASLDGSGKQVMIYE